MVSSTHPAFDTSGALSGRPAEANNAEAFIEAYGRLFERSPWVVERAWAKRPFRDILELHDAFMEVLGQATDTERLGLIRAHPELADKAALAEGLTADSAKEQAGAGLDRLSSEEFATFHELNEAYRTAHGIPFIICVKLHDKASILAAMRSRLERPTSAELEEALRQIGLIAQLRLADLHRTARP